MKEARIAKLAASALPASMPTGGAAKWLSGSEMPQKIRPMPMPAPKSMANQEAVLCSGRESSGPNRMFP